MPRTSHTNKPARVASRRVLAICPALLGERSIWAATSDVLNDDFSDDGSDPELQDTINMPTRRWLSHMVSGKTCWALKRGNSSLATGMEGATVTNFRSRRSLDAVIVQLQMRRLFFHLLCSICERNEVVNPSCLHSFACISKLENEPICPVSPTTRDTLDTLVTVPTHTIRVSFPPSPPKLKPRLPRITNQTPLPYCHSDSVAKCIVPIDPLLPDLKQISRQYPATSLDAGPIEGVTGNTVQVPLNHLSTIKRPIEILSGSVHRKARDRWSIIHICSSSTPRTIA